MNLTVKAGLAACCLVAAWVMLLAGSTSAQKSSRPRVIQIDTFTCGELLALSTDREDRVLIFLNGYVSGARQQTIWDERAEGAMIERALASCQENPAQGALSVFMKAARQ